MELREGDGEIRGEDQEKCNILNKHFAECFNREIYNNMPGVEVGGTGVRMDYVEIDEGVVRQKLLGLKWNKAGGVDGLPSKFLQKTAETICSPLYYIYCETVRTTCVPED